MCYSYSDETGDHTHWTYVSNKTKKEHDPWPGGITNTSSNKTYWQKAKKTYYPLDYYK